MGKPALMRLVMLVVSRAFGGGPLKLAAFAWSCPFRTYCYKEFNFSVVRKIFAKFAVLGNPASGACPDRRPPPPCWEVQFVLLPAPAANTHSLIVPRVLHTAR